MKKSKTIKKKKIEMNQERMKKSIVKLLMVDGNAHWVREKWLFYKQLFIHLTIYSLLFYHTVVLSFGLQLFYKQIQEWSQLFLALIRNVL